MEHPGSFGLDDPALSRGRSAVQRVVEAVRRHYWRFGASPSLTELAIATSIARSDVWRALRAAERDGVIRIERGKARGIVLADPVDMIAASQMALRLMAIGCTVSPPAPIAAALQRAFPTGTDCELPLADLLHQIDLADGGRGQHGGGRTGSGRTGATQDEAEPSAP